MRQLIVNLITIGVVFGFLLYAYFEYKICKGLRKRSGGGGESRPAKKNP